MASVCKRLTKTFQICCPNDALSPQQIEDANRSGLPAATTTTTTTPAPTSRFLIFQKKNPNFNFFLPKLHSGPPAPWYENHPGYKNIAR